MPAFVRVEKFLAVRIEFDDHRGKIRLAERERLESPELVFGHGSGVAPRNAAEAVGSAADGLEIEVARVPCLSFEIAPDVFRENSERRVAEEPGVRLLELERHRPLVDGDRADAFPRYPQRAPH